MDRARPSSSALSLGSVPVFDDDPVDENAITAPGVVEWPAWAHDPPSPVFPPVDTAPSTEPVLDDPSSWDDVTKPFVRVDTVLPRS